MGARSVKRLVLLVAGAALVGGLGGAGIELAVASPGGSSGSSVTPEEQPASAAAAPSRRPLSHELDAEAVYRDAAPGVVVITATRTQQVPPTLFTPPAEQQVRVLGSGIVLDRRGDIVSNDHVVQGGSHVTVGFSAGATYSAKVLGADPSTDLAVIRVRAPSSALHPLRLDDSNRVRVGDTVYAIGNPFGLDRTMTAGIVSATGRDIEAPNGLGIPDAIQTDAPINHGNSGGPLLDARGGVIGIDDQIESGSADGGNVGVGFAIASDTARTVVRQLIGRGRASHAWLGVEVAPLDPEISRAVKGVPDHGVLVVRVVPGSPAVKAGLKVGTTQVTVDGDSATVGGDVIVAAGGKQIRSTTELADAVRAAAPGDRLKLELSREGQERTVAVTLGNAPR